MQDRPLDLGMILRHAERLHSRKTIATRVEGGIAEASFAEIGQRERTSPCTLRRAIVELDPAGHVDEIARRKVHGDVRSRWLKNRGHQ